MKKLILTSALVLSIGTAVFISCTKDKKEIQANNPASSSTAVVKNARLKGSNYTLESSTNNSSTNGYRMTVSLSQNGNATVNSKFVGNLGYTAGVQFDLGDLDFATYLKNDSSIIVTEVDSLNMHRLTLPKDNKKYWLVPFDSKEEPVAFLTGSIYVGCKCTNTWNAGCYLSGNGCATRVCISCQKVVIRYPYSSGGSSEAIILRDKGYAVVPANEITFNNVVYR